MDQTPSSILFDLASVPVRVSVECETPRHCKLRRGQTRGDALVSGLGSMAVDSGQVRCRDKEPDTASISSSGAAGPSGIHLGKFALIARQNRAYLEEHGKPVAFYSDKHGI